jgi:hypothetical protein
MNQRNLFFGIIFAVLLGGSIILHAWTIRRPLVGHHDMLNGQVVTTVDIWNKEGIFKYNFAPVYSYNSIMPVREGFGVVGKNGRTYYVSYPPFMFILVYFISKIPFIGLNFATSKIVSIMGFIALFLMIFQYAYRKYDKYTAFFATAVFAVFPISAYFLGNVYFVDIAMLPFWFLSFLLFLKLLKTPQNPKLYICFFATLFIVCFTEWFGLLLSASLFFMVLIFGKKFKWNLKYRISFMFNLIITSLISLVVTFGIFLSQIEAKALWSNMYNKYLFRSNAQSFLSGDIPAIKTYFSEYWTKLTFHFMLGFGQYYVYLFILLILSAILFFRFKPVLLRKIELVIILFFFVLAPALHFIVFNQFHYWHDFGNLYLFFMVIFLFMWCFKAVEKIVDSKIQSMKYPVKYIFGIIVVMIIIFSSTTGYRDYFKEWLWVPEYFPEIYKNMRNITNPDDLILTNFDYNPMNWYYYQRAVIGPIIGQQVLDFKNPYPKAQNVYYMSNVKENTDQSCGKKSVEFKNNIYYCKLN